MFIFIDSFYKLQDDEVPDIYCPVDITNSTIPGLPSTIIEWDIGAQDNSGTPPMVQCVPSSGSTFHIGTSMVDCTATDEAGNVNICMFDVTIEGRVFFGNRLEMSRN